MNELVPQILADVHGYFPQRCRSRDILVFESCKCQWISSVCVLSLLIHLLPLDRQEIANTDNEIDSGDTMSSRHDKKKQRK